MELDVETRAGSVLPMQDMLVSQLSTLSFHLSFSLSFVFVFAFAFVVPKCLAHAGYAGEPVRGCS